MLKQAGGNTCQEIVKAYSNTILVENVYAEQQHTYRCICAYGSYIILQSMI